MKLWVFEKVYQISLSISDYRRGDGCARDRLSRTIYLIAQ
jgi:hypothetical protein